MLLFCLFLVPSIFLPLGKSMASIYLSLWIYNPHLEEVEYLFYSLTKLDANCNVLMFLKCDCSDASFGYPGGPLLFKNLNFGIDLDSRIASKNCFLNLKFPFIE